MMREIINLIVAFTMIFSYITLIERAEPDARNDTAIRVIALIGSTLYIAHQAEQDTVVQDTIQNGGE